MNSWFRKLSHSIWHCQYHIVWVPKEDDDEFDNDPNVKIHKAMMYGSMGLSDECLRSSVCIEQKYINIARIMLTDSPSRSNSVKDIAACMVFGFSYSS